MPIWLETAVPIAATNVPAALETALKKPCTAPSPVAASDSPASVIETPWADSAAATTVTLVAVALAIATSKAPSAAVMASSAAASAEAVVTVSTRNAWPCSETSRMLAPEIAAASEFSAIAVVWA